MAGYLNQNGNSIGSLLRFIQEQKSASPINPQSSEVGSPLRSVIQEPLSGSEGKGTSKVVSIRPEGTLTPSGVEAKDATPQSSRIGPISIGGSDVGLPAAPASVVASNEPGIGLGIPSATKTVGDVMNKTAGASEIKPPSIGTSIKSATPTTRSGIAVKETQKGQEVGNYNFANDKANADKTYEDIKAGIAAGERSTAETEAILRKNESDFNSKMGDDFATNINEYTKSVIDAEANFQKNPTSENQRALNMALKTYQDKKAASLIIPSPTPTPMPSIGGSGQSSRGSSGGGSGQSSSSAGQSRPTQSIAPKIMMSSATNSQASNYRPSSATQSLAPKQTPAKSAPAKSSPSIGTIIGSGALQAIKKLFGR